MRERMTKAAAAACIGRMSLLKYYPSDPITSTALIELVMDLCEYADQAEWLGKRVRDFYREWPGAHEIRAVFCSKYRPKDGVNAYSAVYVDGIPSERESAPLAILGASQKQLEAAISPEVAVRLMGKRIPGKGRG